MLSADDLLTGPRGRRLCLAVAHRLHGDVWSALFYTARDLDDPAPRHDLVRVLGQLDPVVVRGWQDPLAFVEPVAESVNDAMYWQPPHEENVVAADPDVLAALRPIAEAIAASPAAAWWDRPVDLDALRLTNRYDAPEERRPPVLAGAREQLVQWHIGTVDDDGRARTDLPDDPTANYSGRWWSTPSHARLPTTTRPLPGLGAVELMWEEDTLMGETAAVWPLRPVGRPRVYEIDGPHAWTALVDRYPRDVTHARRHDWYHATGRAGVWRIPDWTEVAADWDGVHLSVGGYLTTATRSLALADGEAATVLGGWNPDQTWWLTDVLELDAPEPEMWHNDGQSGTVDRGWRQV